MIIRSISLRQNGFYGVNHDTVKGDYIMAWYSGIVTDVEQFFGNLENEVQTDAAPFIALIRTAFSDALGYLNTTAYAQATAIIEAALKAALASNPNDLFAALEAAVKAALPQLEAAGIQIAENVLMSLAAMLLPSLL